MLPSWSDRIEVFLASDRIDWVKTARGFKPVQDARVTESCTSETGIPPWQPALQKLEQQLLHHAGSSLEITLSNQFIRYVTLPPQEEITTPEEVKAYATFRIREIYADRVDSWVLSISEWNPRTGAVCAAIPLTLMAKLEELALHTRCKLRSVEPYLASVYDHWYSVLSQGRVYLAVIESGRICAGVINHGNWLSIRNQRIAHSIVDELVAILDQEAVLVGSKEALESVYVFAPGHPNLVLPQQCGWQLLSLSSELLPAPAHYPTSTVQDTENDRCLA